MGFTVAGLALARPDVHLPRRSSSWLEVDQAFEIVTAYGLGASTQSPCSAASAAASTPKPLTSAPTSSARSRRASPRTIPATPPRSRTTSATTSATWPAWAPTCSSRTPARSSRRFRWSPLPAQAGLLPSRHQDRADAGNSCRTSPVPDRSIAFVGMVASIIGSFLVKGGDSTDSKATHCHGPCTCGTNVAMGHHEHGRRRRWHVHGSLVATNSPRTSRGVSRSR